MNALPSLDAHGHLDLRHPPEVLAASGAVLAMTLTPDEATRALARREPWTAWGAGCYPRRIAAQEGFDAGRYRALAEQTAILGEIGLDTVSPVPLEAQQAHLRVILGLAADLGRITSIHSYRATALVLEELRRIPQPAAILHWWTGSAEETGQAAALGCCFSIHSAVARQSKFRIRVPREHVLVETDHGYVDPPAAIPCRVEWVEHLVGQQYGLSQPEVRELCWRTLARLVARTGTMALLPEGVRHTLARCALRV
ncbi:MAG: TatD family hydrolase [Anaerolineae bacterium]